MTKYRPLATTYVIKSRFYDMNMKKQEQQAARNPFKRVFEYITWGGMPMATIAIHEDDFNDDVWNEDAKNWDNIRVEICVGGSCIGTTLKRIIESHNQSWDITQSIRCPKHDVQPLYDGWCAECYMTQNEAQST